MARQSRLDIKDQIFHVINRSNAKLKIFVTPGDYEVVIKAFEETLQLIQIDIFSFCIMPNHWHFIVKPKADGDMGRFFGKFTQKVTQRWHAFHETIGTGHLFQGRFKSFLVDTDSYFVNLTKYVEANPLRAKLTKRAEDWQWGSLFMRQYNVTFSKKFLAKWPIDIPNDYLFVVNKPLEQDSLNKIRISVEKGRPLGKKDWVENNARNYNLEYTLRNPGRAKSGSF